MRERLAVDRLLDVRLVVDVCYTMNVENLIPHRPTTDEPLSQGLTQTRCGAHHGCRKSKISRKGPQT